MDYLRNVKEGIRSMSFSHQTQDWESENDVSVRDIRKLALRLVESAPFEQREEAMVTMGHIAYVGGIDASQAAGTFLPHLLDTLKNPKYSQTFRVTALKSLCEICHGYRQGKELLIYDKDNIACFISLIRNISTNKDVRVGRWVCYLLALVLSGTTKLMMEVVGNMELRDALVAAADYRRPWTGWGMNMADLLLKLLNHREPAENVSIL